MAGWHRCRGVRLVLSQLVQAPPSDPPPLARLAMKFLTSTFITEPRRKSLHSIRVPVGIRREQEAPRQHCRGLPSAPAPPQTLPLERAGAGGRHGDDPHPTAASGRPAGAGGTRRPSSRWEVWLAE